MNPNVQEISTEDAILEQLSRFTRGQLFNRDDDIVITNDLIRFRCYVSEGDLCLQIDPWSEEADHIAYKGIIVEVRYPSNVLYNDTFKGENLLRIPIGEECFPYSLKFFLTA